MNNQNELEKLSEPLKALIGNQALNLQVYDMLPTPIEIFAPDGMCILYNKAAMELNGVGDANDLVGKYNLKNDPVCLEILGQECIDKIFRGETVLIPDFPAPINEAEERGVIADRKYEAAIMDILCLPIWDGDVFVCTITFYTVKKMYHGKPEIVETKKYIDEHWLDEFNEDVIAKAVNFSPSHLRLLFRNNTGTTMYDYYKSVKVDHIKEKLADKNLTVAEAFSFCGEDSRGWFGKIFKQLTGMTPTEYKDSLK
ncbi:MAG: AraC family transcriptional regulator [Oscillospiraceae bacterium]|nr:AraC family transcriptional regulator [Oscillospiraceae bacterium]